MFDVNYCESDLLVCKLLGSNNFDMLFIHQVACKLYAAVMFYCFMSVFTWMFVEGVHLYQMIIIAFVSRSMMRFYYSLGWGTYDFDYIHLRLCNDVYVGYERGIIVLIRSFTLTIPGFPAVIVAIASAITYKGYGTDEL